jgi:uncharacterized membrane protein
MNSSESHARSLAKTLSYRVWGSLGTTAICYAVTGKLGVSLGAGAADVVLKLALYFMHERVWSHIDFGRRKPAQPDYDI